VASISAIVPAVAEEFGLSSFVVGKINWAYMLPYGICALFYGPLTRLFRNKQINVVTLSLFALFSFLSGSAAEYRMLFIFRLLAGVFAAGTTPLVLIYLADRVGSEKRGKYVGFFFSATFISTLVGLFLSGLISWRWIFFIPGGMAVVTVVLTALYLPKTTTQRHAAQSRYMEALSQPAIWRAFAHIFLISLFYHGVRQWLGVYFVKDLGWQQFWVSMALVAGSLAGVFGEVFGGLAADRKGRVPTLKAGLLLMTVSVGLFMVLRSAWAIPVLMLAWGFGWTVNHAAMSTHLTDLDKRFMKEISSLNSSVRFVAGGIGVVVGGSIFQQSFRTGFFVYMIFFGLLFLATDAILKVQNPKRGFGETGF